MRRKRSRPSRALAVLAAILVTAWLGLVLSPLPQAGTYFGGLYPKDVLVRVSLQTESSGILLQNRDQKQYVPQAKVSEVAEFDGIRVGENGHVVSYIGSYIQNLDLASVRATIRTLGGRYQAARVLGVDERLSLLFLEDESASPPPGLQLSQEIETERFNLAKIIDNQLQVASACIQSRDSKAWYPYQRLVVTGLLPVSSAWRGSTSVDLHGRWLGIVTEAAPHEASRKLANCELLPARAIHQSLQAIKGGVQRIPAGWLGVFLEQRRGEINISDVEIGSPADAAGLLQGDVVLGLDDHDFRDISELVTAIRWKGPGGKCLLTVRRGYEERKVTAILGIRERKQKTGWKMVVPQPGREGKPPKEGVQVYRAPLPALLEIGLFMSPLTTQLAEKFKSPTGGGLLVSEVTRGSRAEKAGFQAGDVIYRVNGTPVLSLPDIEASLGAAKGGVLELRYVRDGKLHLSKIALE